MNFLLAKQKLNKKYGEHSLAALSLVTGQPKMNFMLIKNITLAQFFKAKKLAAKLSAGMPEAYAMKTAEFMGYNIFVSKRVLIPRQETQLLCERVIAQINENGYEKVLDLCTGSGAIAVLLAMKTNAKIVASDISAKALKIARKNARTNGVKINYIKSDLFEKINETVDLIVSNPPYIKLSDKQNLDDSVKNYEPHLALFGGQSGLEFYKKIAAKAPKYLKSGGQLWLEIGFDQGAAVEALLKQNFENITILKDYGGNDRMVQAKLKGESNDR